MRTILIVLLVLLLFALGSCLAQPNPPAHAQAPFATPTLLPSVQATLDAAQQRYNAAQSDLQQADQFDAQAAEYRRNGLAQQAQAQQDIGQARAAVAAQNYEAIGENIGRASSDLDQLSKTNAAQNNLIATLTANQRVQAAAVISLTGETQQLRDDLQRERADHQTTLASYNALSAQQAAHQNDGSIQGLISIFAFIIALILIVVLAVVVLSMRRGQATEPAPSAVKSDDAPEDDEPPIEGEVVTHDTGIAP